MDPYEELIAEHDSILYENIKDYVPLIPDLDHKNQFPL